MQSLTRLGTFEQLIENTTETNTQIATHLRHLIIDLHPEVIEVPRLGEKTATYGLGEKKMSEAYAFISVHSKHVNLGFYHGVEFDDPTNLLEGTGKRIRHIKLKSIDEANQPAITTLLKVAIEERRNALGR